MIQEQHWYGVDRVLITDEEYDASVQLDIFPKGKDEGRSEHYNADCLVWGLWVDKNYRGLEVGEQLMSAAITNAKLHDCKSIAIEYDNRDTPEWVKNWYERMGFKEVAFGRHSSLMVKQLE